MRYHLMNSMQIDNAFKEFQTKAQSYSSDAANQTDVTNQARQKELESMGVHSTYNFYLEAGSGFAEHVKQELFGEK